MTRHQARETERPVARPSATDTLRQIIDAVESTPPVSGHGFVVTLYLPWGMVVGELTAAWVFDQKVAGELQTVGDGQGGQKLAYEYLAQLGGYLAQLGKKIDPVEDQTDTPMSDEYVHLCRDTFCHVNGQVYRHDQLRVRLADVTAWTFGRPIETRPQQNAV